jgi:hypothetical protein
MILTMSHWSSGLPVCFPPQGSQFQIPWGDLCETWTLLLVLSCYIGDPNVIDHQQDFAPPQLSLGPRADNVTVPLDLTQLSCPGFTLAAGLFWLHNWRSRLLGGSPVESLQSHMIFTMSHWSSGLTCLLPATRVTGSNPLGGLMWSRDSPVSVVSLHSVIF